MLMSMVTQMIRKFLFATIFFVVIAIIGVQRFDYLATKPMDPDAFSWINKIETVSYTHLTLPTSDQV